MEDIMKWYMKAMLFMLALLIVLIIGAVCEYTDAELNRLEERVIVDRFESLSKKETYEGVANTFIDRWYGDLEFKNLEIEGLEIEGVKSGVVAQIEEGKYMVITNQVIPEAYHSGPAALFFSEQEPIKK